MSHTLHLGDCLDVLRTMPDASVNCCVTSPPYWGLRDYGHADQIGLESTPEAYVARMVEVFRDVRRLLRDDGTCWVNLGDSYANNGGAHGGRDDNQCGVGAKTAHSKGAGDKHQRRAPQGLKAKDLIGIPWRVAFALQADGWYLRQDIIWHKPNPMPESVTDRCTKAHEYVFLLSKSARYYYDADAIKEADQGKPAGNVDGFKNRQGLASFHAVSGGPGSDGWEPGTGRNRRDVWTIATKPFHGAHFAVMPPALVEPCILAGCPKDGVVLDPFTGSGTVGEVALLAGRQFVGIELNPEYHAIAEQRISKAGEAGHQPSLFS
jgi:DNA modification methylase